MIRLYTTHCPKCKIVELKLKQANIEYDEIDDVDIVVSTGKANNILSAPILEVDGKYYNFSDAITFLKGQQ